MCDVPDMLGRTAWLCPHVPDLGVPSAPIDIRNGCLECGRRLENLCLCLHCQPLRPLCRDHMHSHAAEGHHLAINVANLAFWCYLCSRYVYHPRLEAAYRAVHHAKFSCQPGEYGRSPYVTRWQPETVRPIAGGRRLHDEIRSRSLSDHIAGCLYGQALGDAVGLATEFMTRKEVVTSFGSDPIPFPNDRHLNYHNSRWMPGDWTDDTDQSMCILDALVEAEDGRVDPRLFARHLKAWASEGFPELGDWIGTGLGDTVRAALEHPAFDGDPAQAAVAVRRASRRKLASNGAAMRSAILGCYRHTDLSIVAHNARAIARVTHADPRCVLSAVAVAVGVATLLQHEGSVVRLFDHVLEQVRSSWNETGAKPSTREKAERYLNLASLSDLRLSKRPIGYTFKCMGAGFWGLRSLLNGGATMTFERVIDAVIREGGDADTNAAVCGALCGCHLGYSHLPEEWLELLPFRAWLDTKLCRFFLVIH
jgi:ADP-ribosylglycohydrolase